MPQIDRDGVRIHYESHGSGPAVLLTHGYASTSHMRTGQIGEFSGDYRVIAWDMRGHGQSDSPEDQAAYTEQATVEDMAAVLRACGEERAVIGGLSLGGYMSLAFWLEHPEMTRALMVFDTGPGYRNPRGREAWNETAIRRAERFEQEGLDALGAGDEVRRDLQRSAAGLAKAARGMLTQVDDRVISALERIDVPTLVLAGANDTPFLAGIDYMANKIPGARKVIIANAGHASNLHQPQAFNAAVREFLASL